MCDLTQHDSDFLKNDSLVTCPCSHAVWLGQAEEAGHAREMVQDRGQGLLDDVAYFHDPAQQAQC